MRMAQELSISRVNLRSICSGNEYPARRTASTVAPSIEQSKRASGRSFASAVTRKRPSLNRARNRLSTFTLCYKVSGPCAPLRESSQSTRGKGTEMIENCQNKAGCSDVCPCQVTPYDKESKVPRGH